MGLFDLLGITKRVNETDISRKKEEIDSLYNEMVTIADKLTETVQKIKDLKEKLENTSSDASAEADKNKSEVSNNNETEPEETDGDGAQVNEDLVSDESDAVPAATQPAVVQATPSTTEQPLFGTETPSNVPAANPDGATNNNVPPPTGNFTGQQPQTQQPQQYGQPSQMQQQQQQQPQQQQQQYGQPMQNKSLDYGLKSSDPLIQSNGGKKNSNTKSASALKRKRRTRRNKKAVVAAVAAAASASAAEASAET